MRVFKQLKLGTKVSIGFGMMFILLLISVVLSMFSINRLESNFSAYQKITTDEMLLGRIQANLLESRVAAHSFIELGGHTQKKAFEGRFNKMLSFIFELKRSMDSPAAQKDIEYSIEQLREYNNNFNKIVAYNDKRDALYNILITKGPEVEASLQQVLESEHLNKNEELVYGASKALNHLLSARLDISRFLELSDSQRVNVVKIEFSEIDVWIEWLKSNSQGDESQRLLNRVQMNKQIYASSFLEIASVIEERNRAIKNLDIIGAEVSAITENIKLAIIQEQVGYGPKIKQEYKAMIIKMTLLSILALLLSVIVAMRIIRFVVFPIKIVTGTFKGISEDEANLEVRLNTDSKDELGEMAKFFNKFMEKLQIIMTENKNQSWVKTGQAELSERMSGDHSIKTLSCHIMTYVARYVNADIGTLYIQAESGLYELEGGYAYKKYNSVLNEVASGDGIVGQAALTKQSILVSNVPENYLKIRSGVGEAVPKNIIVVPCMVNNEVIGIIELGAFNEFTPIQLIFLDEISESIAMNIRTLQSRIKTEDLLDKTLIQSEELQVQQEELRQSNEEFEEQTRALKESEERLQVQQEELRVINEELVAHARDLEQQKKEIQEKAEALEVASKYKTEFLANMSHELRTPLNSILVLSQLLADKKDQTPLTEKQLEFAGTIHTSGSELLRLINDVLDLSKIEVGKMDILLEPMSCQELAKYMEKSFRQIGENKGLEFKIVVDEYLPETIITDEHKVKQIINNLLSNAFKFTEKGEITLEMSYQDKETISISVTDTGIGIQEDKQSIVFEAFKQSDGTISRKYGGTGLGLSITKELTQLLGGSIDLISEEGKGSTFTLFLPLQPSTSIENSHEVFKQIEMATTENLKKILLVGMSHDVKHNINEIIYQEDTIISSAYTGKEAIRLLKTEVFDCIILDIKLKDMSGLAFLEQVEHENISNMPIIIYTEDNLAPEDALKLQKYVKVIIIKGLQSRERLVAEVNLFLHGLNDKPHNKKQKKMRTGQEKEKSLQGRKILIVDDDMRNVFALSGILEEKGIKIVVGRNGIEGINKLKEHEDIDLILMDIMMPEMDGYAAIREIRKDKKFSKKPIIALTAKAMKEDRQKCIEAGANDYLTKPIEIDRLLSLLRVWLYK